MRLLWSDGKSSRWPRVIVLTLSARKGTFFSSFFFAYLLSVGLQVRCLTQVGGFFRVRMGRQVRPSMVE